MSNQQASELMQDYVDDEIDKEALEREYEDREFKEYTTENLTRLAEIEDAIRQIEADQQVILERLEEGEAFCRKK